MRRTARSCRRGNARDIERREKVEMVVAATAYTELSKGKGWCWKNSVPNRPVGPRGGTAKGPGRDGTGRDGYL